METDLPIKDTAKPGDAEPAGRSSNLSSLGVMAIGLLFAVGLGLPFLVMKNCLGFVVIFGVLAATMIGCGVRNTQARGDRLRLSAAGFALGCSLSLTLGLALAMQSDPLDRAQMMMAITTLGLFATAIVTGALAVSAFFSID